MQPNQQPAPPAGQYDFIFNPQQPKKTGGFGFGGSLKNRLSIIVVAGILLLLGFSLVSNLLSSGQKTTIRNLKTIVAQQQEIIRIAEAGAKDAKSTDARGFALTVKLSVTTDQQKMQTQLGAYKAKMTPQELAAKKSSDTDKTLADATTNNRYDEVLRETLASALGDYQRHIRTAYDGAVGTKTKATLESSFANTELLLGD